MSDFVTLKYKLANRNDKRKSFAEYKKIFEKLNPVEVRFYEQLFLSPYKYGELYEYYLLQFQYALKYVHGVYKPKYWELNAKYFVDNFSPEEKELTESIFKPIRNIVYGKD